MGLPRTLPSAATQHTLQPAALARPAGGEPLAVVSNIVALGCAWLDRMGRDKSKCLGVLAQQVDQCCVCGKVDSPAVRSDEKRAEGRVIQVDLLPTLTCGPEL